MSFRFRVSALAFLAIATTARGQGVPTSQPNFITIFIEEVKPGVAEAHARHEAGWPAAYEKARSPYTYIALVSMTGRNEAWYVANYQNHAALGDAMKREDSDSALSAALGRLSRNDAQFLNGTRSIHARARTDLSYGAYPNVAMQRYWEVTWFRVRPGHDAGFTAAAKAYGEATKRSAPSSSYRIYEVVAGAPGPTYIVFSSVGAFADFDKGMADGEKVMMGATKEEGELLTKFSAEGLINVETQRFRLDPLQSYVTKEVKDQDPAFWYPKRTPPRPGGF